jgi:NAD(P)H-dependent FMN reductase
MLLEEAAELFPEDMCEDEIEDLLADPWLDDTDREALEVIMENL